ncbi:hypothetical protein D3C86_1740410 [compost metagenome]
MADHVEAISEYGITLSPWDDLRELDALILAVGHRQFVDMPREELLSCLNSGGVLMDIKSVLEPSDVPDSIHYWSL